MPRGQKRAHYAEHEVPDDSYETERITKCSLSSLCHPRDRYVRHLNELPVLVDVRPYLRGAIVYCSQLIALVSMVAKHHIFATLKEKAENATSQEIPDTVALPFKPDLSYLSRVKTMIVGKKLLKRKGALPSYYASLQSSRNAVLMLVFGRNECPPYGGKLSETTRSTMMNYMMKQLAENLATHVKTHANDCVKNWLNNQLRAQLTDEEYNSEDHRRHIGRLKRDLSSNSLADISANHEEYKRQLSPPAKPSTARLVALFYRMRVEIDTLEATTERKMKLMAVVPEAQMGVKFVKIDNRAATNMVKDIYKAINRDDAKYDSNMDEDDHWATLFNLQKVKRLRGNARFGFSISTDGIAACVQFKVLKPISERPVRKSTLAWTRENAPARDITGPGLYSEKDLLSPDHTHLVAIDPGVKSVLTAVRLDDPTLKPLKVSQGQYREASKLNWTMKKLGSHTEEFKKWMGDVMETLTNAPSKNSVLRYSEYLSAIGEVWNHSWHYHRRLTLRRIKFYAWRRREAWMTK